MTRWNWKRWAFAIVTGTALAGSLSTLASDDMPKAGESITLKYPGQPDRVVTVVKSTRKPDGSLETEVKDGKSGETFMLIDPAPENKLPSVSPAKPLQPLPTPVASKPVLPPAPLPPMPVAVKPAAPPAPVRPVPTEVPQVKAPVAGQTPMPPMAEPKDKRLIGNGKLLNREPEAPVAPERPGILGRVFGKKPTPPAMPAQSLPAPAPVTAAPTIRPNTEPPRAQPAKPVAPAVPTRVAPPTPVVPPVSAPSAPGTSPVLPPSKPVPPIAAPTVVKPQPVETVPAPVVAKPTAPKPLPVESIPVPPPPAKPTLPSQSVPAAIPTIPNVPMSNVPVTPAVVVQPVVPMPAPVPVEPAVSKTAPAFPEGSVEALSDVLKHSPAPSARLKAVKELATGPHAAKDSAKAVLFHTAKTDPCSAVKADCIEHLVRLGYRDRSFVEFVKDSCADESGEVRLAAKNAMEKLTK